MITSKRFLIKNVFGILDLLQLYKSHTTALFNLYYLNRFEKLTSLTE